MNKNLYSLSYMLFMAGTGGAFLLLFFVLLDQTEVLLDQPRRAAVLRAAFWPFIWMGNNAIFVFVFAAR